MQEVRPFIQLFRYDLSSKDYDHFQKIITNTRFIQLVEWQENWDFVAIVCKTDHPDGTECIIEDYGDLAIARKRYHDILTALGANDGTAYDREKIMKKAVRKKAKDDKWLHDLIQKAKAAGYDPFADKDDEEKNCETCGGGYCDECPKCPYEGGNCNNPKAGCNEKEETNNDGNHTEP